MKCGKDPATLYSIFERDRVVEFLAGFNNEYDQVRVQILGREKLSSPNEVFSVIRSEEHRRTTMLGNKTYEGLAMFTNKGANSRFKPLQERGDVYDRLHGKEGM